jgi:hypothetical protein
MPQIPIAFQSPANKSSAAKFRDQNFYQLRGGNPRYITLLPTFVRCARGQDRLVVDDDLDSLWCVKGFRGAGRRFVCGACRNKISWKLDEPLFLLGVGICLKTIFIKSTPIDVPTPRAQ